MFRDGVSQCSPGWPGASVLPGRAPNSTSQGLGFKACDTTPGLHIFKIYLFGYFACVYACAFHACPMSQSQKGTSIVEFWYSRYRQWWAALYPGLLEEQLVVGGEVRCGFSYTISPPLLRWSLSLERRVDDINVLCRDEHSAVIVCSWWLEWAFVNHHRLQTRSLMRVERCFNCGYKDELLGVASVLYPFSRVTVVGSPFGTFFFFRSLQNLDGYPMADVYLAEMFVHSLIL